MRKSEVIWGGCLTLLTIPSAPSASHSNQLQSKFSSYPSSNLRGTPQRTTNLKGLLLKMHLLAALTPPKALKHRVYLLLNPNLWVLSAPG